MKVGSKRHSWDIITDKCVKCGLEKRRWQLRSDNLINIGLTIQYFVNGEWVKVLPDCEKNK